jgi:hypothetical protein
MADHLLTCMPACVRMRVIHSIINASWASFLGPDRSFQFRNPVRSQSDSLNRGGGGISRSHGPYLHTGQRKRRISSQSSSMPPVGYESTTSEFKDSSCLRQSGHCDRLRGSVFANLRHSSCQTWRKHRDTSIFVPLPKRLIAQKDFNAFAQGCVAPHWQCIFFCASGRYYLPGIALPQRDTAWNNYAEINNKKQWINHTSLLLVVTTTN